MSAALAPLLAQARRVTRAGLALVHGAADVPPCLTGGLLTRELCAVDLPTARTLAHELEALELMLDVAQAHRAAHPLDP